MYMMIGYKFNKKRRGAKGENGIFIDPQPPASR
jgi:hypothetical protein